LILIISFSIRGGRFILPPFCCLKIFSLMRKNPLSLRGYSCMVFLVPYDFPPARVPRMKAMVILAVEILSEDLDSIRSASELKGETIKSRVIRALNALNASEGFPPLKTPPLSLPGRRRSSRSS
jgi:hypothetical protein